MYKKSFPRRTKIIATVGPATQDKQIIRDLIENGVNVFRLNFSHGDHHFHANNIVNIRNAAQELKTEVAILADLQGPKIRVGEIPHGPLLLNKGDTVNITNDASQQNEQTVFTPTANFATDVMPGDRILIDDGMIELVAKEKKNAHTISCKVIFGGLLKNRKGINLPDTKLSISSFTEKDTLDLSFIAQQEVDFIALSFVRTVKDLEEFAEAMKMLNCTIPVIAKIEKPEALLDIEAIVNACYGVMVARGDLGVEIPPEKVPFQQKKIARYCNKKGKPVIIATQMLESMVNNAVPTRAEANDVANAVLDGADALMLSAETAAGSNPVRCVQTMARIIKTIEEQFINENKFRSYFFKDYVANSAPEAVCYAAVRMAIDLKAKTISCVTRQGNTALHLSRHRTSIPILAITDNIHTLRKLILSWGIFAEIVAPLVNTRQCLNAILQTIENDTKLEQGDLVVFTVGLPDFTYDSTNTIRIHTVDKTKASEFL